MDKYGFWNGWDEKKPFGRHIDKFSKATIFELLVLIKSCLNYLEQ